jgi:universal stress protein E
MTSYNRILVVIDPMGTQQPALFRAQFLAEKFGAHITLVSCVHDKHIANSTALNPQQKNEMKSGFLNQENQKLSELVTTYGMSEYSNTEVVWHKNWDEGVIQTAKKHHCDLIIKSTKKHNKLMQKLFTPHDWRLLRNSPVNVMMVKNHEWTHNGNIVSAVNVEEEDTGHQYLNSEVSEASQFIAQLMDANLHLANAYLGAPAHIAVAAPQFRPEVFTNSVKSKNSELMNQLAEKYNLPMSSVHIDEGMPEDTIPALCNELDAELLVLGSIGRKGLSAAIMGNTAEHIIDKIECDTLVVKYNDGV